MNKVIVLDFGYIQHSAIFASRINTQIPVTYTIMRMMIGYLKKVNADLNDIVLVAQDYGSWRKECDKLYKAQRKEFRESFEEEAWWKNIYQTINDFVKRIDESLPWQVCKMYKAESDDWASVACRYYTDKEIILVSSDRDWEQLCVFNNVKIFSPKSKKYKLIKNPMKVLVEKIHGDKSDNLLKVPSNEAEFETRKKIVDLINPLPEYIENPIKEHFIKMLPKNLYINKIPFNTIREEIKKLYNVS